MQLSIGKPILLENRELHQIQIFEKKHQTPVPLISELSMTAAPKKKNKKLQKLANMTPPPPSTAQAAQFPDAYAFFVTVPPLISFLLYLAGKRSFIPNGMGESSAVRKFKGIWLLDEVLEELPLLAYLNYKA